MCVPAPAQLLQVYVFQFSRLHRQAKPPSSCLLPPWLCLSQIYLLHMRDAGVRIQWRGVEQRVTLVRVLLGGARALGPQLGAQQHTCYQRLNETVTRVTSGFRAAFVQAFTIVFPTLSPFSIPMNAAGMFSNPSVTSSRYWILACIKATTNTVS